MVPLDDDLIETLAAGAYEHHSHGRGTRYADLDEPSKEANRDGVRAIPDLVAALGYRITDAPSRTQVDRFADEEIERAAPLEHDRWERFTRSRGYTYGATRDDTTMTHPDLVPWEELDEETRDLDRVRIRAIPWLLAEVGLALEPTRP